MPLQIILPWPDMKLSTNRSKGVHWASLSAARGRRRSDAHILALQAIRAAGFVAPAGDVPVSIVFVYPTMARRDRDNLLASLKHDLDGISAALGIDDEHFEPITLRREYGKKPGSVIVEIG